ncbi:GMC family oxidoreductase N-terminal domain-containing protein [Mycobacterium tilburgii]|uniref:GMC family oxidoreductase N-terminal domain-containing protein n=1 Tax=Mycobacterium tilburgii TaxID=44467 RepID=UPI0021B1EAAB|nr:GMC family oxidoreductase N-terminal domain-containing protein [Mycobacterium tilburgii]
MIPPLERRGSRWTPTSEYNADVIVVGAGGSAGAAVTRRLVDHGLTVLVLEAGGPDTNSAIADPARMFELWSSPDDWAHQTVPRPQEADRRLNWPRGKVLAGRAR